MNNIFSRFEEIESILSYSFKDKSLLTLALTHRSFVNENRGVTTEHNERLEFLGDSVLGVLVAEYLYKHFPETPEGELSHLRSRLVESQSCAAYIKELHLEEYLLLGKGERLNGGRGRESILADLFEALIGAIFLDGGFEAAKHFLFTKCAAQIGGIVREPVRNCKAELQDYSQKKHQQTPIYTVLEENGPDHSKEFKVVVIIDKKEAGTGMGASKKEAQQAAAAAALQKLLRV